MRPEWIVGVIAMLVSLYFFLQKVFFAKKFTKEKEKIKDLIIKSKASDDKKIEKIRELEGKEYIIDKQIEEAKKRVNKKSSEPLTDLEVKEIYDGIGLEEEDW